MKRLFLMAAVAVVSSVLATACSDSKTDSGEDSSATIMVEKSIVSVPAEGAECTINYTISGGGDTKHKVASATSDVDWVTVIAETEESILISVSENSADSGRYGTVKLSYNTASVYVAIFQSESTYLQVDENMRFNISVKSTDAWSVSFTITPTTQSTYYYGVIDKRSYNKYGSDFVIEQFVEYIQESIEKYPQYTINDFLAQGAETQEFSSLWSMTDYYIVAFDLNTEYRSSGNVTIKEFSTEPLAESGKDFTITADGAKITIKPKNATMSYIYDAVDIEYWSQFPDIYYTAYDCLDRLNTDGIVSKRLSKGTVSYDFSSELSTDEFSDFVAYAFGSDGTWDFDNPSITTDISYIRFIYEPSTSSAVVAGVSRNVLPKSIIGRHR